MDMSPTLDGDLDQRMMDGSKREADTSTAVEVASGSKQSRANLIAKMVEEVCVNLGDQL